MQRPHSLRPAILIDRHFTCPILSVSIRIFYSYFSYTSISREALKDSKFICKSGCTQTFSYAPRLNENSAAKAERTTVREHLVANFSFKIGHRWTFHSQLDSCVPRRGFEPLTCPLGGDCAIHLCHRGFSKL